jgi:hypothetical protein
MLMSAVHPTASSSGLPMGVCGKRKTNVRGVLQALEINESDVSVVEVRLLAFMETVDVLGSRGKERKSSHSIV